MRRLVFHELCASPSRYAYELSYFGFTAILDEVVERTGPFRLQHAITFDDGHQSDLAAAELLSRRRLLGDFFLTAGWVGNRPGFLSWDEARAIARRGHTIGSHGWTHRLLTRLPEAELRLELERSREVLQDQLGVPVDTLAVPGGRWNARVAEAACAAGYRTLLTNEGFRGLRERHGLEIDGRLHVRRDLDPSRAADYLAAGAPLWAERAQGAVKRTARTLLGDRLYRRVWAAAVGAPDYSGRSASSPDPSPDDRASRLP
jgi:peptidoglycan/xylan/chitin deacetylase (PgdA/CDA1 family)